MVLRPSLRGPFALFAVALAPGCDCAGNAASAPPRPVVSTGTVDAARDRPTKTDGIVVERVAIEGRQKDTLTLVRIDPKKYPPRLLTAEEHGGPRTVAAWAKQFRLAAVVNASMYDPKGKSVSLMVDGDRVNNGRDDAKFGGILAFGPVGKGDAAAPVTILGRSCGSVDVASVRRSYRTVIANYRLLDCDGRAIGWKDEKIYSAAAIGMDRDGQVVLAHARAPHRMDELAKILAAPELRLTSALYVEGGPEASLYVASGGVTVNEVGSYETGFREDDTNVAFWDIPNVVGFAAP